MKTKSPDCDTIIEDIHAIRRRIAETFGHDLAAILEDARRRQSSSAHPLWRPKAKPSPTPETP